MVVLGCGVLSSLWLDASGRSVRDVVKGLKERGWTVSRHRPSTMHLVFQRYIPIAASLGGLCVGALSVGADALGVLGSGTGILMAVGSIQQYESLIQDELNGKRKSL